jgi:hypothetical protein
MTPTTQGGAVKRIPKLLRHAAKLLLLLLTPHSAAMALAKDSPALTPTSLAGASGAEAPAAAEATPSGAAPPAAAAASDVALPGGAGDTAAAEEPVDRPDSDVALATNCEGEKSNTGTLHKGPSSGNSPNLHAGTACASPDDPENCQATASRPKAGDLRPGQRKPGVEPVMSASRLASEWSGGPLPRKAPEPPSHMKVHAGVATQR